MRTALALIAMMLAGCVSQKDVLIHEVTDNEAGNAHRRAEVHTALAGEYFSRGAFGVALSESRLAIKDDSNYAPAYNVQGLVYMELREDGPAREAFDRALSLEPKNAQVLNNFGWFLCTRGDTQRAMEMLQSAATSPLYPTPEKAYLSMGLCMRRMNRNDEAEKYLRRAVLIRPELIGALYNLAVLTYERGDYKEAEKYLNRYMRLATPGLDALVLGVKVTRANHDDPGMQSYLMQLRRRYPDAPQTHDLANQH